MHRLLLFAALAAVAAGCGRCGKASQSTALARALPRDAELIVLVPDLGALGDGLVRLQKLKLSSFAAQLQGAPTAADAVSSAMSQLGVDLRSRPSLERAGLDPARGAAAVWSRGNAVHAVAALKDEAAFRQAITTLARERLGAVVLPNQEEGTLAFGSPQGGPAVLTVLFRQGFALVGPGAVGPQLHSSWPADESRSLATDPDWVQRLAHLPAERQVLVRLPPSSSLSRSSGTRGSVWSLDIAQAAISVHGVAGLIGALESSQLLRRAQGPAATLPVAPPDAFFAARSLGAASALSDLWPHVAPQAVQDAAKQAGFDVQKELFNNLKPGTLLALSLSPNVNLSTGVPQLDLRRTNPFGYLHLVAAAQVKDAARAEKALQVAPALARRFGAELTPAERSGQRVYLASYAQGEGTHLALVGDTAVLAAPVARLDATLARIGTKAAAEGLVVDPIARPLLEGKAIAAVLDVKRLTSAIRNLPSSAWGIGGFAIRATALRWLVAFDDLKAVTFWAEAPDGELRTQLQLHVSTAPEVGR